MWEALEAQFKKGPPPFMRPGWTSPLLGKKVDLRWLDAGPFEQVKGSLDGWRDARLLVIEFWASCVPFRRQVPAPCSRFVRNCTFARAAAFEPEVPCHAIASPRA